LSDISISPRTPCDGPPKVCVMSDFAMFCSRLLRCAALSPLSRNESAHRGGSAGASSYEGAWERPEPRRLNESLTWFP
jgi:hypothetical protein